MLKKKKSRNLKGLFFLLKSSKDFNVLRDNIMDGDIHIEEVPKSYVEFPKLFWMEFSFCS